MDDSPVTARRVTRVSGRAFETLDDDVAVERALEIRIDGRPLSVTLRSPGHDLELALGFLAGEGVVTRRADVVESHAIRADCADQPDALELRLAPSVRLDWTRLERHFAATAACGLCGRAHLESLRAGLVPVAAGPALDPEVLGSLADPLRTLQQGFAATGGVHAAAFFERPPALDVMREDVGRHNAVDKVVGWLMEQGRHPVRAGVLWVSGRAGAEIVLKAARAGIPVLAAVGAPSSLAIELAEGASMTLIGFLREGRMNVYSGVERLRRV